MRHYIVPALLDCLNEGPAAPYPYPKSFEDGAFDPFVVIHTSGSTGLPKPITIRLGSLATIDAQNLLPPFEGYEPQIKYSEGHNRVLSGLPPYHVSTSYFEFLLYQALVPATPSVSSMNIF